MKLPFLTVRRLCGGRSDFESRVSGGLFTQAATNRFKFEGGGVRIAQQLRNAQSLSFSFHGQWAEAGWAGRAGERVRAPRPIGRTRAHGAHEPTYSQ